MATTTADRAKHQREKLRQAYQRNLGKLTKKLRQAYLETTKQDWRFRNERTAFTTALLVVICAGGETKTGIFSVRN
jgi:hypothetical protein